MVLCLYSLSVGYLFQLLDPDISEFHLRTVTQKTDMSGLVKQSGMFTLIHRTVLGCLADVTIEDGGTVEDHLDVVAIGNHLLVIPFAGGFQVRCV